MKEKGIENKIREAVRNELPLVFCQDAENEIVKLALDFAEEYTDLKIKKLTYFIEHSRECILSKFEEGEPTENGGYRQKYAGKWYQTRPINNIPKCTCGLDQILSNKDKK